MATLKTGTVMYNPSNAYSFTNSSSGVAENFAGITCYSMYKFAEQMTTSGVYRGLFLYRGTPATQADLDGISTTTPLSAWSGVHRYSDLLLVLPVSAIAYSGYNQVASLIANPAWASGTATWFMYGYYYSSGQNSYGTSLISGSVGLTGSGSDLELDTTTFTSGVLYKMPNISIPFPNGYSV